MHFAMFICSLGGLFIIVGSIFAGAVVLAIADAVRPNTPSVRQDAKADRGSGRIVHVSEAESHMTDGEMLRLLLQRTEQFSWQASVMRNAADSQHPETRLPHNGAAQEARE